MKNCLLTIFILFTLSNPKIAGGIEFDKISYGFSAGYLTAADDFGEYWKDAAFLGIHANYQFDNELYLEGAIFGSKIYPGEHSNEVELPEIILINIPIGLKYSQKISSKTAVNYSGGLSNTTFAFTGEAAEIVEENPVENEVGVFLMLGFSIRNKLLVENKTEIFIMGESIFSKPETIEVFKMGLRFTF